MNGRRERSCSEGGEEWWGTVGTAAILKNLTGDLEGYGDEALATGELTTSVDASIRAR